MLSVGEFRRTKGGDQVRILNSKFICVNDTKKDPKTKKLKETGKHSRQQYIFCGKIVTPGPKRAKDKEGKFIPVAGLEWDAKGKAYGKKKDTSYDLV
jgi:hypothetical protein